MQTREHHLLHLPNLKTGFLPWRRMKQQTPDLLARPFCKKEDVPFHLAHPGLWCTNPRLSVRNAISRAKPSLACDWKNTPEPVPEGSAGAFVPAQPSGPWFPVFLDPTRSPLQHVPWEYAAGSGWGVRVTEAGWPQKENVKRNQFNPFWAIHSKERQTLWPRFRKASVSRKAL